MSERAIKNAKKRQTIKDNTVIISFMYGKVLLPFFKK